MQEHAYQHPTYDYDSDGDTVYPNSDYLSNSVAVPDMEPPPDNLEILSIAQRHTTLTSASESTTEPHPVLDAAHQVEDNVFPISVPSNLVSDMDFPTVTDANLPGVSNNTPYLF